MFMGDQTLSELLSTVLSVESKHLQLQAIQMKLQKATAKHSLPVTCFCAKAGAASPLLFHLHFLWFFLTKQEQAIFVLTKVAGSP